MLEKIDSYEKFIKKFNIDKNDLFEFGIRETILPEKDLVDQNWKELKKRIYNNGVVSIRGYGRDAKGSYLYTDMYKEIFNNENIKKDGASNTEPTKIISELTGYKKNKTLFNYQVSHIFGKTKNIFLFEAPWNIAYIPKIIYPLTGHETKGFWPQEYQKLFIANITQKYAEYIDEYNNLITQPEIKEKINLYLQNLKTRENSTKEILRFEKSVMEELAPIELEL